MDIWTAFSPAAVFWRALWVPRPSQHLCRRDDLLRFHFEEDKSQKEFDLRSRKGENCVGMEKKNVPAHIDILHSSSRFVKIFLPRIFPEIEKTNTWKNSNNCWSLPACKSHSEVSVGGKETLTVDSTDEHSSNRDQTQAADVDRAFSVFQSLWLKHN